MQNILTLPKNHTMTSVEVVEVINSLRPEDAAMLRHSHFMERCKRIAEELGQPSPRQGEYLSKSGQTQPCYLLDKEMSIILVASESAKVMQAIVRRWQELESQQLPLDYESSLRRLLAAEQERKRMLACITQQDEIIADKKLITNEGEEYHSVKRIKELNPNAVIGGRKLATSSAKLNIPPKALFTHYDINNPMVWHISVWVDAYPELEYPE